MFPTYKTNQKLLIRTLSQSRGILTVGDVIVFSHPVTNQKIIKRVAQIKKEKFYVLGDNKKESTDSRSFGWIDKKSIIGKVIYPV